MERCTPNEKNAAWQQGQISMSKEVLAGFDQWVKAQYGHTRINFNNQSEYQIMVESLFAAQSELIRLLTEAIGVSRCEDDMGHNICDKANRFLDNKLEPKMIWAESGRRVLHPDVQAEIEAGFCPVCGAALDVWKEQLHEEHNSALCEGNPCGSE